MSLLKMFYIFFKIGAFTFGGGYAMIPLIEKELVEKEDLIKQEEFLDIIALSQSIPGAIALNTSTYIGYRTKGILGGMVACLGVVLPSFFIILLIASIFSRVLDNPIVVKAFLGIRSAVVALILSAVFKMSKSIDKSVLSIITLVISSLSVIILGMHPIFIIVITGIIGYIRFGRGDSNEDSI